MFRPRPRSDSPRLVRIAVVIALGAATAPPAAAERHRGRGERGAPEQVRPAEEATA